MINKSLHFNKNGEFKIMVIGDIHESPNIISKKDKARFDDYIKLQTVAIDKIKPDLAIFIGDMINADSVDDLEKGIKNLTSPFCKKNVPFALVRGNHDGESGLHWEYHERIYKSIPNCLYCLSEEESDTRHDYNLLIKSSDGKRNAFNLWFINCGKPEKYDIGYDYTRDYQIKWYEQTCDKIAENNNGNVIPAMIFQHIPVCEEFLLLQEKSAFSMITDGISDSNGKKSKFYKLNKKTAKGYLGEKPCSPLYNSGQFESWQKKGDIIAAIFGHDHINDFIGKVDGIYFAQCKLAGFGPYGDGLQQGHRVITLNENNPYSFRTEMTRYREMIGMKCNSIHGRVKYVHDRTGVKIDLAEKVLGISALIGTVIFGLSKIIKKK